MSELAVNAYGNIITFFPLRTNITFLMAFNINVFYHITQRVRTGLLLHIISDVVPPYSPRAHLAICRSYPKKITSVQKYWTERFKRKINIKFNFAVSTYIQINHIIVKYYCDCGGFSGTNSYIILSYYRDTRFTSKNVIY